MGRKNFSRNNLGQRKANDFYQTPLSMTERLLELMPLEAADFPVMEPACGGGAIVQVLERHYPGARIMAYDIKDGGDFLLEDRRAETIITNPPFSLALDFMKKCKEVARRRFALLLPIDYLHGSARFREVFDVVDDWPLVSFNVFVRRAMLEDGVRADGKYHTGMITWAWYVWEHRDVPTRSAPIIRWLDNDADVIRRDGWRLEHEPEAQLFDEASGGGL